MPIRLRCVVRVLCQCDATLALPVFLLLLLGLVLQCFINTTTTMAAFAKTAYAANLDYCPSTIYAYAKALGGQSVVALL